MGSAGLMALMFLSGSWQLTLLLFIVPAATTNVYLAPVLAQVQSLVALRMRAVASALVLLIISIIGLALGPTITGAISDGLNARFGSESMRYALLVVSSVVLPWAAFHYWQASRFIDADLERVDEID